MPTELDKLIESAKRYSASGVENENQRRSFAFGNTNLENPQVTREMVDAEAERLKQEG